MNNGQCNRDSAKEHAKEVADSRPDHRRPGAKRPGVDDRSNRVCGIVEAVYNLKAQGNEQAKDEQEGLAAAGQTVEQFEVHAEVRASEGHPASSKAVCYANLTWGRELGMWRDL